MTSARALGRQTQQHEAGQHRCPPGRDKPAAVYREGRREHHEPGIHSRPLLCAGPGPGLSGSLG